MTAEPAPRPPHLVPVDDDADLAPRYTARQETALDRLAQLVANVLKREAASRRLDDDTQAGSARSVKLI